MNQLAWRSTTTDASFISLTIENRCGADTAHRCTSPAESAPETHRVEEIDSAMREFLARTAG
jgi:hypothetical protein